MSFDFTKFADERIKAKWRSRFQYFFPVGKGAMI